MRKFIFLLALLVLGGLSLSATPASATDQGEAVKLCGKNPNCGIMRGNGGVNLSIEGSAGGGGATVEIWCPDKGECHCITCRIAEGNSVRGAILLGRKTGLLDGTAAPGPAPQSPASAAGSSWNSGDIGQWHGTIHNSSGQIN